MTFETNNIFNFSVKSASGSQGNINFIFDNDGNVRFYNKTSAGDHPKVGIGILNTATPEERLDIRGGIKIDTAISQTPASGGHIQYKDGDFQGYDGTTWVSLTQSGGTSTGLESITEGSNTGWRLVSADANNHEI